MTISRVIVQNILMTISKVIEQNILMINSRVIEQKRIDDDSSHQTLFPIAQNFRILGIQKLPS